ncbi:MAG: hypothetical protein HZA34_02025 [Candidatus Pacebacteria bacterium]|nr:hypothetical protein [Candidatus Paceibacterota bacterium]
MKNIVPSLVSISLLGFFTLLFLLSNRIGELSYLALVTLSLFIGLVIYFRKNLSEVDLKNMKLIFQKTQRVKKEVDQVALHLAKIIANLSAYSSGSWLNRKGLNDQIEGLLSALSVGNLEKRQILDLPRTVEKMMKGKDTLTPAEKKKIDDMFSLEEKQQ